MLLWTKVIAGDRERILVTRKGRFVSILEPGEYRLWAGLDGPFEIERHNLAEPAFVSEWADFIATRKPETAAVHFHIVETNDRQVAVISLDGKLNRVVGPASRVLFWKAAGRIETEVIDAVEAPGVPARLLDPLARLGRLSMATFAVVDEGKAGLLLIDNRVARTLGPGTWAFWTAAGSPRVETVDMRRQTLEVPGQEILTRDKVSLRVNILADYQVKDAVKAKQSVKDFAEFLYRALQLAIRQTLAKRTLEEVLSERTDVDEAVAAGVRSAMAEYGIEVGSIALKDIVPPGEVREMLNRVVAAEKEAQANLIRRREETAATRSLLNTAKLMEGNPLLVRMKELEALEKVAAKVGSISVANGFEGLLSNLVTMKQ